MTDVLVKRLGALRDEMGTPGITLAMPEGATLKDLVPRLRALGIDPDSTEIIVTLNDRGLNQWPPERPFADGDVVAVFPYISGG
jgi:molybdopterin converting factor small subunit